MSKHRRERARAATHSYIVEYRLEDGGEKLQRDVKGVRSEEEAKRKLAQILGREPAWSLAERYSS